MQSTSLINQLTNSDHLLQKFEIIIKCQSLLSVVVQVTVIGVDHSHNHQGMKGNIESEAF